MKPVDVKPSTYINFGVENNEKEESQNIRTFSQKVTFQIGLKNFLRLKELKILCR